MYLSRLILNPKWPQVARELRLPYEMHRTLSKAIVFPGDEGFQAERLLFRVEPENTEGVVVLVQSWQKPDWTKLTVPAQYFRFQGNNKILVKQFEPVIPEGGLYQFRLRANPTRKDSATGKRFGLTKTADLEQWLHRKAESAGFRVVQIDIRPEGGFRDRKRDSGIVSHISVLFQGALLVGDSQLFIAALKGGLGSAKGFGFGLLSIAPLVLNAEPVL